MGKDVEMTWKGSKGGIYWGKWLKMGRFLGKLCWKQENMVKKGHLLGKMAENGVFRGEKLLKMGQNA